MSFWRTVLTVMALVASLGAAGAEEWQATKLRGGVFAFVDQQWVELARGDLVPDQRFVRTAPDGRARLQRGAETIDLGPNTQIRIFDREGEKFTIVQQQFGDVSIEAERRNVRHFAVQTEYLAAVVKGTRFSVTVGEAGADVNVERGQVQVRDVARKLMVDVTPGQSASVGQSEILKVSGVGELAPVVAYSGDALAETVNAIGVLATDANDEVVISTPGNTANTPAASVVSNTPAANASKSSSDTTSASGNSGNTPAAARKAAEATSSAASTGTDVLDTAESVATGVGNGVGKALGRLKNK